MAGGWGYRSDRGSLHVGLPRTLPRNRAPLALLGQGVSLSGMVSENLAPTNGPDCVIRVPMCARVCPGSPRYPPSILDYGVQGRAEDCDICVVAGRFEKCTGSPPRDGHTAINV